MEMVENKTLLNKVNRISWNVLMPAMAVTFILFNTVVNLWIGERIATIQNILAILILGVFAYNIFSYPKELIPVWIKENILVIIYFVARLISLWQSGFDYSVIRTIFFEVFFIIGITQYTVGVSEKRNLYIKMFVWIELVLTALSLVLFYMMTYLGNEVQNLISSITYLEKSGNAMLFSNPNTAGLMAGFAIVIVIMCYGKNIINNKLLIIYGLYNVLALVLFGCRSSELGMIAVACILILGKIVPAIKGKRSAAIVLVLMTATLIPLYAFIDFQSKVNDFDLSEREIAINSMSSERYLIWKECYFAQKDDLMFGIGSMRLELEDRAKLVEDIHYGYYWKFQRAATFGPHNGYIGMISGTGIIGLLLFIGILLQRMKKSKSLDKGNWYLMLIFIFVVNCFESLFVLNRFFTCFYMFLLLAIDFNDDGEKIKKLSSQEETK